MFRKIGNQPHRGNPSLKVVPRIFAMLTVIYPIDIMMVRLTPILRFNTSTLPSILNKLGEHWVEQSLWEIKKSLVTLPMRICILPFIKAIMGMTTSLSGLMVCHSPKRQCSIVTLARILYLALKDSLPSGV